MVWCRRGGTRQTIYYSIASCPAQQVLETLFAIYCSPNPICGDDKAAAEANPDGDT